MGKTKRNRDTDNRATFDFLSNSRVRAGHHGHPIDSLSCHDRDHPDLGDDLSVGPEAVRHRIDVRARDRHGEHWEQVERMAQLQAVTGVVVVCYRSLAVVFRMVAIYRVPYRTSGVVLAACGVVRTSTLALEDPQETHLHAQMTPVVR